MWARLRQCCTHLEFLATFPNLVRYRKDRHLRFRILEVLQPLNSHLKLYQDYSPPEHLATCRSYTRNLNLRSDPNLLEGVRARLDWHLKDYLEILYHQFNLLLLQQK